MDDKIVYKEMSKLCYFIKGSQNTIEQIEKRSGVLYCYIPNKFINKCPMKKM